MRLTSKSVIVTGAGVVLLGTSLALSSAGVVSGASALRNSTRGELHLEWLLPDRIELWEGRRDQGRQRYQGQVRHRRDFRPGKRVQ